jgi:hypothetical protein
MASELMKAHPKPEKKTGTKLTTKSITNGNNNE